MGQWKTSSVTAIIIVAFCLAGCCGMKPAQRDENQLETERVASLPAVEEKENIALAEATNAEQQALTTKAKAAGALQTIYFDFDRSDMMASASTSMDNTADWLLKNPDVTIVIDGHCDERGTNEYNMALGERRAYSAKKYLVNKGIASGRLATVSYGEERPVDPGHTEAAWAKNRRDEFRISQ